MERNENLNEMSNDQASSQCLITPRRNLLSKLNITVEPIFFAMFFWFALVDAAGTNIILTRTCTMVFGYSKENCTGEIKPEVTNIIQPYTAKIIMVKSLIEAIFPAILSMFIGSWSDISKRRKPFIIIPLVGSIVEKMLWLLLIYVEAPPLYFILTALPYSLTGGVVGIFTCGYSYISDVSTENNRAFRMSVCSVCLTLGILTGYLVSNEIYEKVHHNTYYILYGVSICSCVLILMYTAFLLPENKDVKESYPRIINKSFFNISHIKKSVEVLFENRPSKGRTVLMLLTFIIVIDILVFQGEGNFRYLSLKATFSWSAEDYNIFSAILSGSAVVTSLIGVWLLKKVLDLNEPFMIFLIVMLSLTSSILVSISKTTTDIYCSALLGCFVVLLSPLVKSEVSYLVPNSDIGKIFALTSTLEAITPFAATPIYTEVYNLVISSKPLYVNFVSAGFWLIATILALIILIINSFYGRSYQRLEETSDQEEISTEQNVP